MTTTHVTINWGAIALLAIGLAFVGLVLVVMVLLALSRSGGLGRQFKTAGLVGVLMGGAVLVAVLAGMGRLSIRGIRQPTVAANAWEAVHPEQQLLRVRETVTAQPAWVTDKPEPVEAGIQVSISSQRFSTIPEAEEHITQLVSEYVKKFYQDECPLRSDWRVPVALLRDHGVQRVVAEEFEKEFPQGTEKMYRAHVQLLQGQPLRDALHSYWRSQIVDQRLLALGTWLGLITVGLGAAAGYFRLNDLTHGQYGGRLKLAAAALVGAAGLGVLAIQ